MNYTNKAKLYLLAKYQEYEEAKNLYGLSKTIILYESKSTSKDNNLESRVNS